MEHGIFVFDYAIIAEVCNKQALMKTKKAYNLNFITCSKGELVLWCTL